MPLGTEIGLGPGNVVLIDRDPALSRKGAQQAPIFRPMSLLAKRSPISATVGLLFPITVKLFTGSVLSPSYVRWHNRL